MRPSRLIRTSLFRLIAPLGFALACALAVSAPALAQATGEQEAGNRARVLQQFPDSAKALFGRQTNAAPMQARAIGSFARGCLAGATALPIDGESWQVMRLARNRNWGHPELIELVEKLARETPRINGWPGLLIGDISQPRGGPMLTGHASHQIGLDADIWLTPMPRTRLNNERRENMPATNMVRSDWMDVDPAAWTPAHHRIVKAAAQDENVMRIFVNPAIKKAMCREAGADRAYLSKVRPMWGHNYHFHIRIACPEGVSGCVDQDTPPAGDGCGQELTDWLAQQHKAIFGPKKPGKGGGKPKPPPGIDWLPAECRQVLVAR
jgi:penicillin-insensitive murein endopeptidase